MEEENINIGDITNPSSQIPGTQEPSYRTIEGPIYGCTDPNASNYNADATISDKNCEYNKTVKLNKNLYGQKKFKEQIDTEFSELFIQDYNISDFFALYNELFYDIPIKGFFSHQTILEKSLHYIEEYIHPRSADIDNLYNEIKIALEQFFSIEEEHPILRNNSLIKVKDSNPQVFYYIQSYKKRQITASGIDRIIGKINSLKGFSPDVDISIPLTQDALDLIPDGPAINTPDDVTFSTLLVNSNLLNLNDKSYLINTYGSGIEGITDNNTGQGQENLFLY